MIYICLVKNVVVLKSGLESFWIPYQKDTGRGLKTVVRKAHSAQSSMKLKEWQYVVAIAAHNGDVMKQARQKCIQAAQIAMADKKEDEKTRAALRFFRTYDKDKIENSVCKMSVLRLYLGEVLKAVHTNKNKYLTGEYKQATQATQGTASELRVFKF
jgi:hypothetical protein